MDLHSQVYTGDTETDIIHLFTFIKGKPLPLITEYLCAAYPLNEIQQSNVFPKNKIFSATNYDLVDIKCIQDTMAVD